MSDTFVTVLAQWSSPNSDGSTAYANGTYQFVASGQLMASSAVALVIPVIEGNLDAQGALSVQGASPNTGIKLLSSDNFGVGELYWDVRISVQGAVDITVANVPVNFTSGATQNLFDILSATGWSSTPWTFPPAPDGP